MMRSKMSGAIAKDPVLLATKFSFDCFSLNAEALEE